MSGLDLLEDGFPHGTVEGHRLGCKGSICARNEIGDTCSQAAIRYAGDWEYRKAVDAGAPLPPMVHDRPKGSRLNMASRLVVEPTVTVASIATPLPVEPSQELNAGRSGHEAVHPSVTRYTKGCKTDEGCPSFTAGGQSCSQVAREYWRDRDNKKRRAEGKPPRRRRRTVLDKIVAMATSASLEPTVTELPDGAILLIVRIPASVVAS